VEIQNEFILDYIITPKNKEDKYLV